MLKKRKYDYSLDAHSIAKRLKSNLNDLSCNLIESIANGFRVGGTGNFYLLYTIIYNISNSLQRPDFCTFERIVKLAVRQGIARIVRHGSVAQDIHDIERYAPIEHWVRGVYDVTTYSRTILRGSYASFGKNELRSIVMQELYRPRYTQCLVPMTRWSVSKHATFPRNERRLVAQLFVWWKLGRFLVGFPENVVHCVLSFVPRGACQKCLASMYLTSKT